MMVSMVWSPHAKWREYVISMEISEFALIHEKTIRLITFLAIFLALGLWEWVAPRREVYLSKPWRWFNNLAIVFFNTTIIRLMFPLAAVGMAALSAERGWGILNYYQVPMWLAIPVTVIVMDLIFYLLHVMLHALPLLWRVHRMHHADLEFDVSTGLRFHPFEIVLSLLIRFVSVVVLGPPVVAVLIFEMLLNVTSMFNHSNIRIPLGIDRMLRCLVVTPDMHRVHHSTEYDERNRNFGFNLSWWDRIFGTYRDQPSAGHEGMTIGIQQFRDEKDVTGFFKMMVIPFRDKHSDSSYTVRLSKWKGGNAK